MAVRAQNEYVTALTPRKRATSSTTTPGSSAIPKRRPHDLSPAERRSSRLTFDDCSEPVYSSRQTTQESMGSIIRESLRDANNSSNASQDVGHERSEHYTRQPVSSTQTTDIYQLITEAVNMKKPIGHQSFNTVCYSITISRLGKNGDVDPSLLAAMNTWLTATVVCERGMSKPFKVAELF